MRLFGVWPQQLIGSHVCQRNFRRRSFSDFFNNIGRLRPFPRGYQVSGFHHSSKEGHRVEPHRSHYADLSLFLRIVHFRSFRRAADHLDMTVSALSHRMKALETRLGVRLLNRTSRSVSPTAAGEALARKVAAGLELINAGLDEVQGQVSSSAGSVRINVLRDAVPLLLSPVLPRYAE